MSSGVAVAIGVVVGMLAEDGRGRYRCSGGPEISSPSWTLGSLQMSLRVFLCADGGDGVRCDGVGVGVGARRRGREGLLGYPIVVTFLDPFEGGGAGSSPSVSKRGRASGEISEAFHGSRR